MLKRKTHRRARRQRDPNAKLLAPAQYFQERQGAEAKNAGGGSAGKGKQREETIRSESFDVYDASTSFDSTSQGSSLESKESSLKPSGIDSTVSSFFHLQQQEIQKSPHDELLSPNLDELTPANAIDTFMDDNLINSSPPLAVSTQASSEVKPVLAEPELSVHESQDSAEIQVHSLSVEEKDREVVSKSKNSREEQDDLNQSVHSEGLPVVNEVVSESGRLVMKSIGTQSQPEETTTQRHQRNMVPEIGMREKQVSPAPKEIAAQPMTKTGIISQLTSQMNLRGTVPSVLGLGDLHIDDYLPGVVKQLTTGGEEHPNEIKKEIIRWTSFERYASKLYLLVGYNDGFHIWDVSCAATNTKVKEVLSIRSGWGAKIVRFLAEPANPPSDTTTESKSQSAHLLHDARPLLAVVSESDDDEDETDAGVGAEHSVNIVRVYSLAWNRWAHEIPFESKVLDVQSNSQFVFIALKDVLFAFDATSLEHKFGVSCFPSSVPCSPFALSHRWLAYAGVVNKDTENHATTQGSLGHDGKSQTSVLRNVSKDLVSGIYYLQGLYVHRKSAKETVASDASSVTTEAREDGGAAVIPGLVVVQDLSRGRTFVQFRSHESEVETMAFNPNGALLATAPVGGQTVHIHRIEPSAQPSGPGRQTLLYKLERGLTHASIRSIVFSNDLRWVALASSSGTAHIFAISFGGGKVDGYTHPAILAGAESPLSSPDAVKSSSLTGTANKSPSESSSVGSAASYNPLQGNWKDKVVQAMSRRLPVSVVDKQIYATPGDVDAKVFVSTKPLRKRQDDRCVVLHPLERVRQRVSYAHHDQSGSSGMPSCTDYPLDICFESGKLRMMSANGVLEAYDLVPFVAVSEQDTLRLAVHPKHRWDVCRREDWPGICALPIGVPSVQQGTASSTTEDETFTDNDAHEYSLGLARGDLMRGDWLSHAEIKSHQSPIIPLWGSPQFRFMTLDDDHGDLPLFVESLSATTVKVRGAGPSPIDPGSGRLVRRLNTESDKHLKDGVKVAIQTPTRFHNLHVASEKEVADTILVYDEEEPGVNKDTSAIQSNCGEIGNPEGGSSLWGIGTTEAETCGSESEGEESFVSDDHADDIFLQDEELYGDAILEEMKQRKQHKLKEN